MAEVQNPIIGKTRKSAGGMTFQNWKGKQTMRAKPFNVANPNTLPQQAQRGKMAVIMGILKQILPDVRVSFREVSKAITEANAFVKANIALMDKETGYFAASEVVNAKFSAGSLRIPTLSSCVSQAGQIMVNGGGEGQIDANDNLSDKLVFVVSNRTRKTVQYIQTNATREESATKTITHDFSGGELLDIYCFYQSADATKASDTKFIQSTTAHV